MKRTTGTHRHAEFKLSKRTGDGIERALAGLNRSQQERVLAAIDRVGEEARDKGARWVERNVIGNTNELLAVLSPGLAADGRWSDLRAIWAFLSKLDVPVDHARLQGVVEKEVGRELAARYGAEAGHSTKRIRRSSAAKRG